MYLLTPVVPVRTRRATATAASTSASAVSGTDPMFSSVLAEVTSIRAELLGAYPLAADEQGIVAGTGHFPI
jgi:hypothetical protein